MFTIELPDDGKSNRGRKETLNCLVRETSEDIYFIYLKVYEN